MAPDDDRSFDREDLRQFEARLDARIQEVNASVVLHADHFAAVGGRIDQADRRADTLSDRIDARVRAIDRRFDALDAQLDTLGVRLKDWPKDVATLMAEHRAATTRATVLGVAGTMLVSAVLVGGTIALAR